jgi:AAA15 family ATPase/GTPase
MLTKIRLTNFRGFADHELPILPLTLIVGRNNAGKSTIIEALRFIALA